MKVHVVLADFGVPYAIVLVTVKKGTHLSYKVSLRNWIAPNHENYFLIGECPDIADMEVRYATNLALLDFQEYNHSFENPGYAE